MGREHSEECEENCIAVSRFLFYAKVILSLQLPNQALRHEDVLRSGSAAPPLLTVALDTVDWSASCPVHFIFGGKSLQ
jgi:hypothetical protein